MAVVGLDRTVYEPRGAARELFARRDPEVLIEGPAGTGKTLSVCVKAIRIADKYPGARVLFVRKTRASLSETVLVTLERDVFGPQSPTIRGSHRSHRDSYRFDNGSSIVLGGLDKVEKIMSGEYDLICLFEATEATENDWESLLTRLRSNVVPYQQAIADCNPGPPTHWLNQRAASGRMARLCSRHPDNPTVTPEYLANLEALTGVRRDRFYLGHWSAAEGAVYDEFDSRVHVIDPFPIQLEWPRYRSIDFGYSNPFVCQWWARDDDGRLYLYREIYRTETLVEDHAEEIKQLGAGERIQRTWADHDAEDRATLHRRGIMTTAARKDVSPGIQAVKRRLALAGDGKPRLYFVRNAVVGQDAALREAKRPCSTLEEFDSYVWPASREGRAEKEEPIKDSDHGMDAMRYMVYGQDGAASVSLHGVATTTPTFVRNREAATIPQMSGPRFSRVDVADESLWEKL